MDEAADYEKEAELADAIDAAPASESMPIDIGEAFSDRLEIKKLNYSQISLMLEKVGGGLRGEMEAGATQQVAQQVQVPKQEISRERIGAAVRLRSMAGNAGREFEKGVARRVEAQEESGLVMPKLSVQDQLADLEKIKEGLDERVFSKEQLQIIREEIGWLSYTATHAAEPVPSGDEGELVLIRNQRVKEIKRKLNMR